MLGIDPHKLHQADSMELTKALNCAMDRIDDLEGELQDRNQVIQDQDREIQDLRQELVASRSRNLELEQDHQAPPKNRVPTVAKATRLRNLPLLTVLTN